MNNPLKQIIDQTGKLPSQLLENELKGVVYAPTLYGLLDERGIPAKTHWTTVESVAKALGYEIVFQKVNHNEQR